MRDSDQINGWRRWLTAAGVTLALSHAATHAQDAATSESAAQPAEQSEDRPQRPTGDGSGESPRGPRGEGGFRGGEGFRGQRGGGDAGATGEDGLVSVSFNNAELRQIAQFYMQQLKKPVIINDEVREARISILAEQRMPPRQAMELIGNALRAKGVMIIESANQIDFLPLTQAKLVPRPVIGPDVSVSTLENQSQIVDKVFQLQHYDATRLQTVITPMLPEYAFTFVDPAQNKLIVTDAAASLRRIEELVASLDVSRATQTVEKIFRLEHGDASEIVSMLRLVVAGTLTGEQSRALLQDSQSSAQSGNRGGWRGRSPSPSQATAPPPGANTIAIEGETPILLQADLGRNWIIAVASPSVMELIERWVKELDKPKEASEPYVLIDVKHADIAELSAQLMEAINSMPDADVRNSVRVVPFAKSRRLMVYGSQRGRQLVEQLLTELDVEAAQFRIFKEIPLSYAAADTVASQINELFSNTSTSGRSPFSFFGGAATTEAELRVTYDTRRNSITVMTDPVKMAQIEKLLAEQWDRPIDVESVQPRIYYLKYTDPSQVQTLLEEMFSAGSTRSSGPWWNPTTTTTSPSGRLGGQFSFQALTGTNILTVTSAAQENYVVIDRVLQEIDRPQEAGLPIIIELKHANAEDVAEQLNAMFSEPGTPSAITRNERGLSEALRQGTTTQENTQSSGGSGGGNNATAAQRNQQNQAQAGTMGFWWAQSRTNLNEVPTSNLIGKPRFVPVNRRNALMILAPQGYLEPLQALVAELDKPGSQVLIQAIIAEVQHDDESTLGMRLASDPSILSDSRLADQAIGGGVDGNIEGTRAFDGFFTGTGVLGGDVNLNFLIQLLIRKVNLKIMNEPRVYTSDNEEAHFFDGQDVPFVAGDQSSTEGSALRRTFENREVGTRLHVRPHITQEGDVNIEVNLELSSLVTGSTVFGNFIVNRRSTTTNITLKDGQTVVISGLIRKEDTLDVRKLPLLGDIPLVGGLFRSTDKGLRNREVVAFITPRIVNPAEEAAERLSDENKEWLQRLRDAIGTKNGQTHTPTDLPAGMQTDESAGTEAITTPRKPDAPQRPADEDAP